MSFALRVDVQETDGFYDRVSKFLDNFNGYFVVEEMAENLHLHMWLKGDQKIVTVRNKLTYLFPELVGNKGLYSLKQCDAEYGRYLQYMCKGTSLNDGPVVKFRLGLEFTDDWVYDSHEKYWGENAGVQESAAARAADKLKGSMVEQIEREAKRRGLNGHRFDRVEIAKIYINRMLEMKKPISQFQGRAVINSVCACLSTSARDQLAIDLAQEIQ